MRRICLLITGVLKALHNCTSSPRRRLTLVAAIFIQSLVLEFLGYHYTLPIGLVQLSLAVLTLNHFWGSRRSH